MKQKSYTLKECKVFNQEQRDYIQQFIRGNYDPTAEINAVVIPDDPHPWKILYSIIEQYYDREHKMAQSINFSRCEMERAQNIIKHNEGIQDIYWQMQNEMVDLRRDNERLKAELSQIEKRPQKQPEALQELIDIYGSDGLIDGIGDVLDGLITAAEYSGSDGLLESMRYTRALQGFFMKLEKEVN